MTGPAELLAAVQAEGQRLTSIFQRSDACSGPSFVVAAVAETIRPLTDTMRSLGDQRAAARETGKAMVSLPKGTLRELTVVTVRCPRGSLLLRVVRIPTHLPGAAYSTHLVIPTSATTYQHGDQRITAFVWFLAEHDQTSGVRCRCHPEVRLSREQLCGESPPPPGIRVLAS